MSDTSGKRPCDHLTDQYQVESESSGAKYTVTKLVRESAGSDNGRESWQCSCRGWTMHTPRRDCKHITYIKRFGGIPLDPLLMAMAKATRKVERAEQKKAVAA